MLLPTLLPRFAASLRPPRSRALPLAVAVACALASIGCGDKTKAESASLLRLVDDLRLASNAAKREPLERLRATPCTAPELCAVRDACVDAWSHHVRANELSAEIRKRIEPGPAPLSAPDREDLARKLLEANIELEQGKELMATCDSRVADLRIKRKL